jgi:hypothetical protein
MIIVPNLLWLTFRYWAIRATDVYGMGSSPRREMVIIYSILTLTSHITNIDKLLSFIYILQYIASPMHHQRHHIFVNIIPMCLTAVCSM